MIAFNNRGEETRESKGLLAISRYTGNGGIREVNHLYFTVFIKKWASRHSCIYSGSFLWSTSASSSMLNTSGSYKVAKVIILHK